MVQELGSFGSDFGADEDFFTCREFPVKPCSLTHGEAPFPPTTPARHHPAQRRFPSRHRITAVAILPAAMLLAGCQLSPSEEELLEERGIKAVSMTMKDPSSLQFMNLKADVAMETVCGQVNGKNSFGAYTGFRRFVMTTDEHVWFEGSPEGGYELFKSLC